MRKDLLQDILLDMVSNSLLKKNLSILIQLSQET